MAPIQSEARHYLAQALRRSVPRDALDQIHYIGMDRPLAETLSELQLVCPNLQALYLDPVHLVITMNQSNWRKSSNGQTLLRKIQAKFNKVDYDKEPSFWGPLYTGDVPPDLSKAEAGMRDRIMDCRLNILRAQAVVEDMDGEKPWYSFEEYIEALAALSALFPHEVEKPTHKQGAKMKYILYLATDPDTMSWYFNNIRVRRILQPTMVPLLPSGTSANEALHAEMARWYRNQPEVFLTTLELQLYICHFAKLISHNSAMYRPTLRQMTQQSVLSCVAASFPLDKKDWGAFVSEQYGCKRNRIKKAKAPLAWRRKALQERILLHALQHPDAYKGRRRRTQQELRFSIAQVNKKPAHIQVFKRPAGAQLTSKRIPFSLRRAA